MIEKVIENLERWISIALMLLMGVVVISGTVEIAYLIATDLLQPPGFFLGVSDLFDIFGLFLMVLIGLELLSSVKAFLKDHKLHAEAMFLIALPAITRKIVIMDSSGVSYMTLFGLAALVLALSVGFFIIRKNSNP